MKRTLVLLLALVLMFSMFTFATETSAGNELKELGIIKGDENGNLNEDKVLSREEAVVILNRMMGVEKSADLMLDSSPFVDVPKDHWAAKQIAYAKLMKWTNGIGNNEFGVGKEVTTQEFLTFMLRALGHDGSDVYNSAMQMAKDYNLLNNAETDKCKEKIKRSDVFIIMKNTLNTKPEGSAYHLIEILGLKDVQTTYPLTLSDGEDREVTIDKEPERIISVAPSVTEILYEIGAFDKLVGRTDYCDYPANVSEIESIGTLMEPNIEKIAELNPDLVIVSTHFAEEAAQQLENLGIKVFVLKAQENFDGLYKTVTQAGMITNHQKDALEVIKDVKIRVQAILSKMEGVEPVTCYYSVSTGETEYTATGDTFMHSILTMAGGDNIAKDGKFWSYSAEKILEHDPQIIFVNNKYDALKTFVELEAHKDLSAVKNNKVIEIDGNRLGRLTPRIVESLEEIANILHPEVGMNRIEMVFLFPIFLSK